jgi:hypothetical protein
VLYTYGPDANAVVEAIRGYFEEAARRHNVYEPHD